MFEIIWVGLLSSVWIAGSEDPDAVVFVLPPISTAAPVFV